MSPPIIQLKFTNKGASPLTIKGTMFSMLSQADCDGARARLLQRNIMLNVWGKATNGKPWVDGTNFTLEYDSAAWDFDFIFHNLLL